MITACMIAFNEEDHIESSIRNILDCHEYINELIIIEGCIETLRADYGNPDGSSTDKTVEIINKIKEETSSTKIVFKQGLWKNKEEMRNEYLRYVTNPYLLIWDADEYYKVDHIKFLYETTREYPELAAVIYPFRHFYHDMFHYASGQGWEKTQLRFSKFYTGCSYDNHYTLNDPHGRTFQWDAYYRPHRLFTPNVIGQQYKRETLLKSGKILDGDVTIYHLGYVKKAKDLAMKLALYSKRDGKNTSSIKEISEDILKHNGLFDSRLEHGINPDPKGISVYEGDYPEALSRHPWKEMRKINYENQQEYEDAQP